MVKLSGGSPSLSGSVTSHSPAGFRLLQESPPEDPADRESAATSVSGYSIYKQRIDAMFDETRSLMSGYGGRGGGGGGGSAGSHGNPPAKDETTNNTVQARIEKMFADVTTTTTTTTTEGVDVKSPLGCRFPVKYLGSVPLQDKVTSLQGLQEPLKELYLIKRPRIPGCIEISPEGLRVRQELKPFQTIAVWAAVQFVLRKAAQGALEFAFLPLIADPDAVDKGSLFTRLVSTSGTILESKYGLDSPPLFAVVMRKQGSTRALECHGFICACSEDAIVIAANLYQALMHNMQRRKKNSPRVKNGVSYVSIGGSSQCGSNVEVRSSSESHVEMALAAQQKTAPERPPRQKKKSASSSDSEDIVVDMSSSNKDVTTTPGPVIGTRRTTSESLHEPVDRGDIMTKIVIPRSQSFMTPGGALMRYSRSQRKKESPLGFHELFTEFRIQEGLHSLDDILDVIIDADGMSFNDLKPIYKEFLMKLAVTLTKDELYQRSKNIMRRQRKKLDRRDKRKSKIKKVFKRSVSKLRPTSPKSNPNFEFTSVLFPTGNLRKKKVLGYTTTSSSSYGSRKRASRRPRAAVARKGSAAGSDDSGGGGGRGGGGRGRASSGYISCSECSYDSALCSCKDKCYCSKTKAKAAAHCNCDTDSCMESDKCYCKNATNVFEQLKRRGFAVSESSESRSVSPSREKPEVKYSKSKKHSSVKSTKSLEFLQIKPKWDSPRDTIYQKRMDVYESLPVIQNVLPLPTPGRRIHSTDNLALDYDLFSKCRERKVLVVSARDTRGRIIYNKQTDAGGGKKSTPNDALSVKKSAEIAALFHEVRFSRVQQQEHDMFHNRMEHAEQYFTMKSRNQKNDLEISLGYLP